MRVKDILHEHRILQEQLWRLGQALKYAAGMGEGMTSQVRQVLAWFSSKVAGKPNAAEELAQGWVKVAEINKVTPAEAIAAGKVEAEGARIAKEVIEEAEQLAIQLMTKSRRLRVRSELGAMEWLYGTALNTYNFWLTAAGIVKPISECIWYIYQAYENMEKGHPEYQGPKLQYIVQFEINKAIREVTAIIAGRGLIAWALGPKGIQVLGPLGWGPIGKAFNILSPAAQASFITWFQTDAGQKYFAEWLVGKALIPFTEVKMPGGSSFNWVTEFVGGRTKTAYDAILRAVGSDKAQEPAKMPEIPASKSPIKIDWSSGQATTK